MRRGSMAFSGKGLSVYRSSRSIQVARRESFQNGTKTCLSKLGECGLQEANKGSQFSKEEKETG